MTHGRNYYTAYDLVIQSEFELPELPSVSDDRSVDVVIQAGNLDVTSIPDSKSVQEVQSEPGRCRITHRSIGTFLIEEGTKVICDPLSPDIVEMKIFRRFLESQVIALLLLQRGLLILHGSAVSLEGSGVVFLGPRGVGKSTTASAFHQEGHTLLEDDIVGIRLDDTDPLLLPGVPQLRLMSNSVDALNIQETTQPAVDWGPEKHYQHIDSRPSPVPLRRCYLLEEGETLSLVDLPGREQFFRFIEHAYPQGFLSNVSMTGDDFERCSQVVKSVPIRKLQRPKEFVVLPRLVRSVAADLRDD